MRDLLVGSLSYLLKQARLQWRKVQLIHLLKTGQLVCNRQVLKLIGTRTLKCNLDPTVSLITKMVSYRYHQHLFLALAGDLVVLVVCLRSRVIK